MDSRRTSLYKTISWRVLASTTTVIVTWAFTGELLLGLAVGGTGAAIKMILYYVHERAWIRWGVS